MPQRGKSGLFFLKPPLSFVFVLLLCSANLARASAPPSEQQRSSAVSKTLAEDTYAGVVIDHTITVAGRDFADFFTLLWREKPMSNRYAISVHERPSARNGTLVWVEHGRRRIFQTTLPSTRSRIRPISEQAADISYQNLIDIEAQRLLFLDPDIAKDEF
ncbi:MAG: curli production assembly/transport protein CsgE [Burkholderiales bacterium]|nr:curli production assembly/transport protein CsgE [Burkholderiales bacterium]